MRTLSLLILSFFCASSITAQEYLEHKSKIIADSTGKIYVKTHEPTYLFVSRADTVGEPTLLTGRDGEPIPVAWKRQGENFLNYSKPRQQPAVRYTINADGQPPQSTVSFGKGLLFNYGNAFFAEPGAELTINAKDNMTGVSETYTSIDNAPFSKYHEPIAVTEEADFPLKIYSVDNVGNVEDIQEYRIITTDSAAIRLNNIYFLLGSTELSTEAKNEIRKLASILNTYPNVFLEIRAHTDSRGSAPFNQTLSEQRAQAVVKELTSRGINPHRLSAKGFGEDLLVNECSDGVYCPEAKHAENRRVELIVLKHLP